MMNYTEIFVALLLLPVVAQIIIPLVMLLMFSLVKAGHVISSLFTKAAKTDA